MQNNLNQNQALQILINGARRATYTLEEGELVKQAISVFTPQEPQSPEIEEKPSENAPQDTTEPITKTNNK